MQDRAFVLGPLMDIAPDWCHPVSGLTVRQMYDRLPAEDRAALKALP
jgi:2-amino-4-hydroxy-6-hydroxymethyldihydropteridine diphosphokinase